MKAVEWILRLAVFGTFVGHGLIAVLVVPSQWLGYLKLVGFEGELARNLLLIIGLLDVALAILVVVKPLKPILIYCAIWAFATALMRPIAGQGILEFIERMANFLAPLALYFLLKYQQNNNQVSE